MIGRKSQLILLALIVVFGLSTRIISFDRVFHEDPTRVMTPDSYTYDAPAQALLRLGRFSASPGQPETPEVMRTPGYPVFIAGHYLLGARTHFPVIIGQIIFSVLALVVTFLVGRRLAGPGVGLAAATLLLFDPVTFLLSQMMLTETLFTFCLLLIVLAGFRLIEAKDAALRWAFLVGLGVAVSAMVRPISYYLIYPMLAAVAACQWRRRVAPRVILRQALMLALPFLLIVGLWQVRNQHVAGRSEFSYIQSYNLLFYRGAGVIALRDRISFPEAQKKLDLEMAATNKLPIGQRCAVYQSEGARLIRSYPWLFLKTQCQGVFATLLGMPGAGIRQFYGLNYDSSPFHDVRRLPLKQFLDRWVVGRFGAFCLSLHILLFSAVLYLGCLLVPWRSLFAERTRAMMHLFLLGMLAYLILVSAGPEAGFRFRTPVMPILAIYSGLGLKTLFGWLLRAIRPPSAASCGVNR